MSSFGRFAAFVLPKDSDKPDTVSSHCVSPRDCLTKTEEYIFNYTATYEVVVNVKNNGH